MSLTMENEAQNDFISKFAVSFFQQSMTGFWGHVSRCTLAVNLARKESPSNPCFCVSPFVSLKDGICHLATLDVW